MGNKGGKGGRKKRMTGKRKRRRKEKGKNLLKGKKRENEWTTQ